MILFTLLLFVWSSLLIICAPVRSLTPPPAPAPAFPPPREWQTAIDSADMLYTPNDEHVDRNVMPMIGNGMVGLQIGSDAMYISGVFNNYTHYWTSSHRAAIPTGLAAISVKPPGVSSDAALDIRNARYLRRSFIEPNLGVPCTTTSLVSCTNSIDRIVVEQRFYAHRTVAVIPVVATVIAVITWPVEIEMQVPGV